MLMPCCWHCTQIVDALNRRRNRKGQRLRHAPSAYITGLLVPRGGAIKVDMQVGVRGWQGAYLPGCF